ncbi:MAG TPA: glycosyltransferase family protein [Candidatus Deferrimicrobium sp.]|nr:glycosyltransferase family protein [Candidatus Deferrimicrobium sp.]
MKTVVIVQARMTSTRLPGKVMMPILKKAMLEHQLGRLARVETAAEIIVAMTSNSADIPIRSLCERLRVRYFCGPEEDVLSRCHGAARARHAGAVVRITADCPLIDPGVVDEIIAYYLRNAPKFDYVSNTLVRTYPRGLDCEVFSFDSLQQAFLEATARSDREHVTPFIYRRPERFRLGDVRYDEDHSHHRWTVDTAEDFELVRRIIEALSPMHPHFTWLDCLNLVRQHPDWEQLNAHIAQKEIGL